MSVFDKLNGPRFDYLLRCKKCGEQNWYTVNLSDHQLTHYGFTGRWCVGELVCVEKKERP